MKLNNLENILTSLKRRSFFKNVQKFIKLILLKLGMPNKLFDKKIYLLPNKKYYSQYGQDYFVSNIMFQKKSGFYVDVGARCGKVISNTYHLEQKNWEGLCIEPHPDLYKKLTENRTCITKNCTISDSPNKNLEYIKFLEEPFGNSGLLTTFRNPKRLEKIKHEIIIVNSIDLTSMLDDINAPQYIHYLDIDVEGHEYFCLAGIDFSKYRFGVIGVETTPQNNSYKKIEIFLKKYNYIPFAVFGSDTLFIEQ